MIIHITGGNEIEVGEVCNKLRSSLNLYPDYITRIYHTEDRDINDRSVKRVLRGLNAVFYYVSVSEISDNIILVEIVKTV